MPDFKRPTIDELLQRPPAEVMAMFQTDLRMYTGSIEGAIAILREDNLSRGQEDQLIAVLHRSIIKTRDAYDYMLIYLEKLQESRKADE
jgi:hypothetical protein